MGRPKVPNHMKKVQVSVSLPVHLVERIDLMTSRRSQWIHRAISARLDSGTDVDIRDLEVADILEDLEMRFPRDSSMAILLKQIQQVYEKLP